MQKNITDVNNETATKYIKGIYLNSMSVFESTPHEVNNIVDILKSSNSIGYDQISPNPIKDFISEISTLLSNIITLSFNTDKVPNQLKMAKIIPIYKSNDKQLVSN